MKKKLRILLTAWLLWTVLAASLPLPAAAAGEKTGKCGEALTWRFEDGVLTLSGSGAMTDYAAASLIPWNGFCEQITEIVLPEGITSICDGAFRSCRALQALVLPDGLVSVGREAFAYSDLLSVSFPASVASVGEGAFAGCLRLSAFSVAAENPAYCAKDGCLIEKKTATLAAGCASAVIPADGSVKKIAARAFYAVGAKNGAIPEGVTEIGAEAFRGAVFGEVSIPTTLTAIGEGAFSYCASLTGFTAAGENPALTVTDGCVIEAGTGRLLCGCAGSVIPEGVASVGAGAFLGCAGLKEAVLPAGVTEIGERAFYDCSALSAVTLPAGLKTVGAYAFGWCEKLAEVTLPEGVTALPEGAFAFCSGLERAVLPNSLAAVGKNGFFGCESLAVKEYTGTEADWLRVETAVGNDPLIGAELVLHELPVILYGDVSGDGQITTSDVLLFRTYFASYDYISGTSSVSIDAGADANGDGGITTADLLLLRSYLANFDYTTGTSSVKLGPPEA